MSPRLRLPIALGFLLLAGRAFGDSAVRLTDLAPGPGDGLNGLDAAVLADGLYFVGLGPPGATDGIFGAGIYRYDGVLAPVLVAGTLAVAPEKLIAWQGRIYFQGGPADDRELWVYDPAGPSLYEALDVRSSGNGNPQRFAIAGDQLCFAAFTDTLGSELLCWNGVGQAQIFDLEPNAASSYPDELESWGDGLVFDAVIAGEEPLLYYDGETFPEVIAPGAGEPFAYTSDPVAIGSELFFTASDLAGNHRVYRYDGVEPPTRISSTYSPAGELGVFRGQLVSAGLDLGAGVPEPELWRQISSTLRQVDPGSTVASSSGYVVAAGGLYFYGYLETSSNDGDLFRYCGAGPVGVATTTFAAEDSSVDSPRPKVFQGRVFISASDPTFGEELWAITPSHIFCDDFETGGLSSWP